MNVKSFIKKNYIEILIALVLVLVPFDNLPYLNNVLKELSYSGASYAALVLIGIFFYRLLKDRDVLRFNDRVYNIFLVFVVWALASGIFNFSNIMNNTFKGKSGLKRFIFQYPMLVYVFVFSYCVYYFLSKEKISVFKIRKYILISTIIVAVYSVFEVLYLLNIVDTSFILEKVSSVIQLYSRGEVYSRGVRSVTGEASYFSMYAAFVFPWIFSYIYTEKKAKNKILFSVYNMYFISLIFLSRSRVGLAIFAAEFLILLVGLLIKKNKEHRKITVGIAILLLVLVGVVNTVFYSNNTYQNTVSRVSISSLINSLKDPNNLSNVARFSLQEGAISMGLDNPITGVGIGQFAFSIKEHIDKDAYRSNEITLWLDETQTQYWPTVFSLHARIFGELGFVGFALWCILWGKVLFRLVKMYFKKDNIYTLVIGVSVIGCLISGMNVDTFINYPLWIILSVATMHYNNISKEYGEKYEI
ncbi:O-antigen ligase family protein [Clostridium culturomicium]|uniref:O-antigen ligase family protein n=1 Tax=Clostridium culturomicium TaxID=1499683 RepID=UPI00058D98FA|nr:O-antigen ligase family protein [Clostridium culturomicium]